MATRFCMGCGGEFIATVEECPDCELPLVDDRPEEHLDESAEGQIEYELHEWAVESRLMLQQLLSAAGIRHAWEGADLVVSAVDEARVDALVDQVEATTEPVLDPDADKVAYDVEGWSDEQQTLLTEALLEVGIPYEFDVNGALVVLEDDEERVEALLDRIESEGLDAVADRSVGAGDDDLGGDDDGDGDEDADYDGPEAMDVLSELFVAADRLAGKATDAEGVLDLVKRAEDAERMPLPYGFNRTVWRDIVAQVMTVRDLLEADESDDEEIEQHAKTLRDTLRNYV